MTLFALLLFALSAWQANRDVCPGCESSEVALALPDGTPIRARLYLPPGATSASPRPLGEGKGEGLPAVVVCHGYLANLAFMEIPWVKELTRLGVAALFIDRRGHGRSGGTLWPRPAAEAATLDELEPDIGAALSYLRSRQPLIDSTRIALLGHSDGASAAITAASADWNIRATIAVSASVAPWQVVNHVAPQNLLLVYGAEDHFVLNDTDRALIARGTRGYLAGPGDFGDLTDGSARRLVRVSTRGHLDVLYSDVTHREVLEWLRRSLGTGGPVELSGARWMWVWAGAAAIPVLLILIRRSLFAVGNLPALSVYPQHGLGHFRESIVRTGASHREPVPPSSGRKLSFYLTRDGRVSALFRALALTAVWAAGLFFAPWLARQLRPVVPAQEGSVFVALLLGPAATLALVGTFIARSQRLSARMATASLFAECTRNAVLRSVCLAGAVYLGTRVLTMHHYGGALGPSRVVLVPILLVLTFPAFTALELWAGWVGRERPLVTAGCLILLATATAALAGKLFERMSMGPGYLVAAVLILCAADSMHRTPRLATALLGSLTLSWLGALVCALY